MDSDESSGSATGIASPTVGKVTHYFNPLPDSETEDNPNPVVTDPSSSVTSASAPTETLSNGDIPAAKDDDSCIDRPIYKFFTKTPDKTRAVCNLCGVSRSIPTGTTTTLINHLKTHSPQYVEFRTLKKKQEERKKRFSKQNANQGKTTNFFRAKNYFPPDSKRAKEINNALALFICQSLQPCSLVEENSFKYLMHLLEPKYNLPSRTTFSRNIIPKLYQEEKTAMLKQIQLSAPFMQSISITTDMWTSRAKDSFIAFTLQFTDENFLMKRMTVDCQPFPGSHDADSIAKVVRASLKSLNLPVSIKKYICSDSGPNIVKALTKCQSSTQEAISEEDSDEDVSDDQRKEQEYDAYDHVKCYNHTMQLAVNDTTKDTGVSLVVKKVSASVSRYNRSQVARENLRQCQKEHDLSEHELIQMVETRWDSEFFMLRRYCEQKLAIVSEQSKSNIDSLSVNEWKLAEGYVEVLGKVANFTADMGSSAKPTFSMVIPVLYEITSSLEEYIKSAKKGSGIMFARKLLTNIKSRFPNSDYKNSERYQIAMLMDPRFKAVLVPKNRDPAALIMEKALQIRELDLKRGNQPRPENETFQCHEKEVNSTNGKFRNFKRLNKSGSPRQEQSDAEGKIEREVKGYLEEDVISEDDDPLIWWKANAARFPSLAPIARHYLGIAATETDSERVFSVGGNTVTNRRTALLPEHVQEVVFIHDNVKVPMTK